jgi:hypothetical protein
MKKGEAKYEQRDKVWILEDYKAIEKTIESAQITLKEKCEVCYYLLDREGQNNYKLIDEKHIYSSREELIKNL